MRICFSEPCKDLPGPCPGGIGKRHAAAALFALASCAPTANAQATRDYLQRMDTDGDGRVSVVEYQDWMSYAFDRMDANGDGTLLPAELPGGRGRATTRQEYRKRIALTFARQDVDRNGFLNARELAAPPQ